MSNRTLGFGIIGTGAIAAFHGKAIAAIEGAKLMSVYSRTPDHARRFAQSHGSVDVATSVKELVIRPDVHAICITTPSALHREPALAAIQAGKHVMIEKPID